MHDLIRISTEEEYDAARSLFLEYANWLGIDLGFQKFEEELEQLRTMYADKNGGIILCKTDAYIGCVAVRKLDDDIAELKRMYVRPDAQHKGIGTALLDEAMLLARERGYKKMRLDTLSNMIPAMNLYKKNGFREIPAYYFNPEKNTVYFEKDL